LIPFEILIDLEIIPAWRYGLPGQSFGTQMDASASKSKDNSDLDFDAVGMGMDIKRALRQ